MKSKVVKVKDLGDDSCFSAEHHLIGFRGAV